MEEEVVRRTMPSAWPDLEEINQILPTVSPKLEDLSRLIWPEATVILGVSVLTMALLQVIKDAVPLRRWVQCVWFKRWLRDRLKDQSPNVVEEIEEKILNLAAPKARKYFYALPPEILAGQLYAGMRVVLDYPEKYPEELGVFASNVPPDDRSRYLLAVARRQDDDGRRDRLANAVQRNIDTIPIMMETRWRFWLRLMAMLIAGAFVLSYASWRDLLDSPRQFVAWSAVVVVSGYFAPVFHELLARLQGRRERRS